MQNESLHFVNRFSLANQSGEAELPVGSTEEELLRAMPKKFGKKFFFKLYIQRYNAFPLINAYNLEK